MGRDDWPPPGSGGEGSPDDDRWEDHRRDEERRAGGRHGQGPHARGPHAGGPHAGGPHSPGPLPQHIDIPDDASELDALAPAIREELRGERRRRRAAKVRSRFRLTWIAPLAVLMAICLVASVVMSLSPPQSSEATPLGKPTAAPGHVGGLLPAIAVTGRSRAIRLRTRRPAALALVPGSCHCGKLLDQLFHRVGQYQLPLDVAMPADVSSQTEQSVQGLGNGGTVSFTDPHGRLRDTYHASGVTVILVNSHGVVTQVRRDLDTASLRSLDAARLGAGSG